MTVRIIALVCLSVLALIGGLTLTKRVRMHRWMNKARNIVRQCDPCTCGCEILCVLVSEEDPNDVIVKCDRCGRTVSGENIVERWNGGDSDADESN